MKNSIMLHGASYYFGFSFTFMRKALLRCAD